MGIFTAGFSSGPGLRARGGGTRSSSTKIEWSVKKVLRTYVSLGQILCPIQNLEPRQVQKLESGFVLQPLGVVVDLVLPGAVEAVDGLPEEAI